MVFEPQGNGFGEVTGRVRAAEDDVGERVPAALTENEPFDDGVDIVVPTFEGDDAAVGENNDGPMGGLSDRRDQADLVVGKVDARKPPELITKLGKDRHDPDIPGQLPLGRRDRRAPG